MSTQHTPGPWRWEFNSDHKGLHLVGGRPQYDLTIMDFERWGMHSATMRLRDPAHDGMQFLYKLHERQDWIAPFPGREHHKHWCADVVHPDARLIASAPDLLEALELLVAGIENSVSDTYLPLAKARAAIAMATGGKA